MELLKFNLRDAKSVRVYILAGNSTFTIKSETSGEHRTYKVEKSPDSDTLFFTRMLISGNDTYNYIGCIFVRKNEDLGFSPSKKLTETNTMGIKALEYLLGNINKGRIHQKLKVMPSNSCCRCGRTLTTPESIKAGIGPECSKAIRKKLNYVYNV